MVDRHTGAIRRALRAERPAVDVSDFASAESASAVARRVRMDRITARKAAVC